MLLSSERRSSKKVIVAKLKSQGGHGWLGPVFNKCGSNV